MTTSSAFRAGELVWRERMSVSTRVLGWLGVALGLLVLAAGISRTVHPVGSAVSGPLFVVVGLALAWFSLAGSVLPVVESWSAGIYVRNVLRETWVPWAAVEAIVPNERVNVILDAGGFVGAWAVQPGGGRVALITERLTDDWHAARRATGRADVVRRPAWPPRSALLALVGFVVVVLAVSLATG